MLNSTPNMASQGLSNAFAGQTLIPSASLSPIAPRAVLGLTQVEGWEPVQSFADSSGLQWVLSKASSDSTRDVPDPKSVQVTDFWNHEFPNIKQKVYVYVVEGIRIPRVETEKPSRILYQWFSSIFIPRFDPTMITDKEWMKANVYTTAMGDTRLSKLNAICKQKGAVQQTKEAELVEEPLIKVEELVNGSSEGN